MTKYKCKSSLDDKYVLVKSIGYKELEGLCWKDDKSAENISKDSQGNMLQYEKFGSSPYQVCEIDINQFKKGHKKHYKLINEVLVKNHIYLNNDASITPERLIGAFNELINIPNLLQLLADNKELSKVQTGTADTETILKNKQKMAEIYPLALERSQKFKIVCCDICSLRIPPFLREECIKCCIEATEQSLPDTKPDCNACDIFCKDSSRENSVFVVDVDDIVIKYGHVLLKGKRGVCEKCFRKYYEIIEILGVQEK